MQKEKALQSFNKKYADSFTPYPKSIRALKDGFVFMAKKEKEKFLILMEKSSIGRFQADVIGKIEVDSTAITVKVAGLTHHNLIQLREFFPFLSPSPASLKKSFGTGDRLGIATPAHLRAFEGKDIFPVLAQQSVRENERTGRSFERVLDDAIWGCFETGYEGRFGADADHVKKIEDLKEAVECGYTMFTIDPSDFVRDDIFNLKEEEREKLYSLLPEKKELEKCYLEKSYNIKGKNLSFDRKSLRDISLIYCKALQHVVKCYRFLDEHKKGGFDFEVSVDETSLPTSFLAHIFIVEELHREKVDFQNLALRFVGEWQKGIDYIGDVEKFGKEVSLHAKIAKHLGGYKLSLHSGSDKFSVYPVFAEKTEGKFHIKTSGTSYLEAIKVIARKNPSLYREIHLFALKNFEKDKASYHVTTDLSLVPDIDKILDKNLETLLENPNSRQLIHITYGSVLNAKDKKGEYLFKDRIYRTLFRYEDEHHSQVSSHIKKHLDLLEI